MTSFPGKGSGGAVLVDREIEALARKEGLIEPFDEAFLKGASYDLRLGEEFSTGGQHQSLSAERISCKLEPGQFILLTSYERLKLPDDVVGHAGLISKWAQSGLISLFSPQIDPGFEGLIVIPLFNGGDAPIGLRIREPMFTVEFVRTTRPVARGWAADHQALLGIPSGVDVQMGRPDFSAISSEIGKLDTQLSTLKARFEGFTDGTSQRHVMSSTRAAWLAVLVALAALAVAVVTLVVSN